MDIAMRAEIHFHQQDEASIFLESTALGDDAKRYEALLFSCFAARQLVNLGNDMQGTSSLAQALVLMELPQRPTKADFDPFISFFMTTAPDTPRLVDYKGSAGRKIFEAELRVSSKINFGLERKGFGLLGSGLNYYTPHSVMLLLKYLAIRRMKDSGYEQLYTLARVAEFCGKLYLNGILSAKTQLSEAVEIFNLAELNTFNYGPRP